MIARGTCFMPSQLSDEMTDHYGLSPIGIFQYTREIPTHGFVSVLLHPHYNGYHLTHHLFPHIPYYHLPRAHTLLARSPVFRRARLSVDPIWVADPAGVSGWGAHHV